MDDWGQIALTLNKLAPLWLVLIFGPMLFYIIGEVRRGLAYERGVQQQRSPRAKRVRIIIFVVVGFSAVVLIGSSLGVDRALLHRLASADLSAVTGATLSWDDRAIVLDAKTAQMVLQEMQVAPPIRGHNSWSVSTTVTVAFDGCSMLRYELERDSSVANEMWLYDVGYAGSASEPRCAKQFRSDCLMSFLQESIGGSWEDAAWREEVRVQIGY
jgi:hypothetical protein